MIIIEVFYVEKYRIMIISSSLGGEVEQCRLELNDECSKYAFLVSIFLIICI